MTGVGKDERGMERKMKREEGRWRLKKGEREKRGGKESKQTVR